MTENYCGLDRTSMRMYIRVYLGTWYLDVDYLIPGRWAMIVYDNIIALKKKTPRFPDLRASRTLKRCIYLSSS